MFRRIFFITFVLLAPISILAQTGSLQPDNVSQIQTMCSSMLEIAGPDQVRINSTQEFSVMTSSGGSFSGSIVYMLRRDRKIIETIKNQDKYLRFFTEPGEITIEARIVSPKKSCNGFLRKNIRVYESVVTYIGTEKQGIDMSIGGLFSKNNILYRSHMSDGIFSETEHHHASWDDIDQADIIILGSDDLLGLLSNMIRLHKIKPINFTKKKIYIVSTYSRSFLSKILASSLSQLDANRVSLITDDQLYGLLTRMSSGEKFAPIGEELSYEKSKTIYSLSGFLEFLVYAGFSYQLLSLLLSITVIMLILNLAKQVIGFSVFGLYYPVLLAIMIFVLGRSAIVLFALGAVSIILVQFFTKKVHLLLHAKRGLLISVYILLLLLTLGIDNFFGWHYIGYNIFDNTFIIFPIFTMIIVADRIFEDDINIFSYMGIFDILQYLIIITITYTLLDFKALQYFLISYPDSIVLVVIANIVVGRYMGLQAIEYFRFAPLLRRLEEE